MKRQVIRQFLFERALFVMELMDAMIAKTLMTQRPDSKKRRAQVDDCEPPVDEDLSSSQFSAMVNAMNGNPLLHTVLKNYPLLDRGISTCTHCGKRLLNFCASVHYHKYHSGSISNEVDNRVAQLKKVAAI